MGGSLRGPALASRGPDVRRQDVAGCYAVNPLGAVAGVRRDVLAPRAVGTRETLWLAAASTCSSPARASSPTARWARLRPSSPNTQHLDLRTFNWQPFSRASACRRRLCVFLMELVWYGCRAAARRSVSPSAGARDRALASASALLLTRLSRRQAFDAGRIRVCCY